MRHRMHRVQSCGLMLQMQRGLCVSVGHITVSPTKMAEPIEMPFVLWTRVSPMNDVLHGTPVTTETDRNSR